MYILCFYVPESHLESVKNVLFAIGIGRIGEYDHCAWQCLGEGQFRPLAGSDAYIGEVGEISRCAEYKVEMVCDDRLIEQAIITLKDAHPYEEPAYHFWAVNQR